MINGDMACLLFLDGGVHREYRQLTTCGATSKARASVASGAPWPGEIAAKEQRRRVYSFPNIGVGPYNWHNL